MNGKALTIQSQTVLKMLAEVLRAEPNLMINISGHTDNTGSPSANLALSKERANQVKDYLTDNFDIAGDRIITQGLGSKDPIASNKTEDGRSENRRVEIVVRQPDAVLIWFENEVKVQPPTLRPDWLDPVPNYYLYLGYRITTGKKSSAHILYPNKGTLKIGEDATVIIHGLNLEQKENSFIKNIALQDGGLRSIL
ncbi:MAG: OmpA family protein [bacterium]